MAWLLWPLSVAAMSRTGRYLPYGVAALARIGGRYERCWPLLAAWRGCYGPRRWPLRAVLAVSCRMARLFLPVSLAVMSRTGRYLLLSLIHISEPTRPY